MPAKPQPAPPTSRRVVAAPDDLVALVGEQRLRQIHAAIAAELKGLARGGSVTLTLLAGGGGAVMDATVDRHRKL